MKNTYENKEIKIFKQNDIIKGIVLVNFDLQEGQITKYYYPKSELLNKKSLKIIDKNSFPESYSTGGLKKYFFIFLKKENDQVLYNFVIYLRKKDKKSERNYKQCSFVLISSKKYVKIFKFLLLQITEKYDMFKIEKEDFKKIYNSLIKINFENLKIKKNLINFLDSETIVK